ncbi:MAG: oligosaccharide flippase family protein [Sphingomonadaceae bacterium]
MRTRLSALSPVLDTVRGRLAKTTGAVFLLRAGNVALNFAIVALLARLLGPASYGQYSVILALITTLAIPAQFGIPALVVREVSRARADKEWSRYHPISRWAHKLSLMIGIPILLLTILSALAPVNLFEPAEAAMLLAGCGLIVALPLRALRSGLIRGLNRVVLGQIPGQVIEPLLLLTFVVTLAFGPAAIPEIPGLDPVSALAAYFAAVFLAWIIGGLMLRKLIAGVERKPGQRFELEGWKGSLIAFGLANAMFIIDRQVGLLVLGVAAPDAEAGFYKVASQAATFTAMGYVAANMALGPGVAKQWREGKLDAVQAAVIRGSRLSALFAFPVTLFFLVGGGLFLEIVFGADYLPGWPAMVLLVLAQFANCAFGSNTVLLNMSGNERENTKAFAVALAVNVALAFALAPQFGATGAAAAAATSVVLRNLILWRAAHRLCGMETGFWGRVPRAG